MHGLIELLGLRGFREFRIGRILTKFGVLLSSSRGQHRKAKTTPLPAEQQRVALEVLMDKLMRDIPVSGFHA